MQLQSLHRPSRSAPPRNQPGRESIVDQRGARQTPFAQEVIPMRIASLSTIIAGAFALAACSQQTEDAAKSTAESAKEDAAAAASDAVQDGAKAASEVASQGAEAVGNAAEKAADAVGDAANDLHDKVTKRDGRTSPSASPSPAH
jgi:hypothetical protein